MRSSDGIDENDVIAFVLIYLYKKPKSKVRPTMILVYFVSHFL